jgi:hypothetical protein
MVKAIYTKSVGEAGRHAWVGIGEKTYEYKEIHTEEEFQKIKQEIIDELNKEDSPLVKVSFYTETNVPFEISYDDINEDDEYNNIGEVKNMTLEKILADKDSMSRWNWELFNGDESKHDDIPDDEEGMIKYYETHGLLK